MSSDHRDTLGMTDILDEYPVPGPRTLDGTLGFRVLDIGDDIAHGEFQYADCVCQRFGLVHGGAYAAHAEMLATEATIHHVWSEGKAAVGMSNSTNFLRPGVAGTIHAEARLRRRGRNEWVWDVDFTDDDGRLCAMTRMTIAVRPRREPGVSAQGDIRC
jgi:1,4-dihydroxy-2-naphthoyl-CoA hydrolase